MTPHLKARATYGRAMAPTASPKRGEYAVFSQANAQLKAASAQNQSIGARAVALHKNRQLWIEVGAQVADDNNALPFELRQRLFSLSIFVQDYSNKVLNRQAPIKPLIEINRHIMAGLQNEPEPHG